MPVEAPIALGAAQFDAGADDLKCQPGLPKLLADCEALDLRKVGEIANTEASGRLVADVADEVSCRKIVPVELLVIRAFLLTDIHRAPNGRDSHHVFEIPGDCH